MYLVENQAVDGRWRAAFAWSAVQGGPGLTVRRFRRVFELASVPDRFLVFVTADSRYRLWINGRRAGRGPLKGELDRYHYECYDVAPLLREGPNAIGAEVHWFGLDAPNSEIHSGYAGFLLQGPEEADVDTPGKWLVETDQAITPDKRPYANALNFLGYLETVDARSLPHGWLAADFDDATWEPAKYVTDADVNPQWGELHPIWNLVPRDAPGLVEQPRRFARTIRDMRPADHLFGEEPAGWTLEAGESGEIVLDAGTLTTGFLELDLAGGAGRTIEIVYGEQVQEADPPADAPGIPKKARRDELEGGAIRGYQDTLVLDGSDWTYEPFHWRTFWFLRIAVSAGDTDFTLRDARYRFTTWPQELAASFENGRDEAPKIVGISWRTLELCSHETFEDCPYYEQLHYIFDARIEALCSMALAGETRLPKRSILLFRNSMRADGLVHCRVPSRRTHRLPYFALSWVLMVDDLWRYAGETESAFVRDNLVAVDGVLAWFRQYLRDDGLVGVLPLWNPVGARRKDVRLSQAVSEGGSAFLSGLYAMALDAAMRVHREAGLPEDADRWAPTLERVRAGLVERCWEPDRRVFAESPELAGGPVSQHAQVMPILACAGDEALRRELGGRLFDEPVVPTMEKPYAFYLSRALEQTGHFDRFDSELLVDYREMMARRLTTWQEHAEPSRSDCHAWTSWPAADYLTAVLGIKPGRPGFREILVEPSPVYETARGRMPTPVGPVAVELSREGGRLNARVTGPAGVPIRVRLPGAQERVFPDGGSVEATGSA